MTAIQLRFEFPNSGTTSPLTLRFEGEPPPPPTILPPWLMTSLDWQAIATAHQTDTSVITSVQRIECQIELVTGSLAAVQSNTELTNGIIRLEANITLSWQGELMPLGAEVILPYGTQGILSNEIILTYGNALPQYGVEWVLPWTNNQIIHEASTSVDWVGLPTPYAVISDIVWRSGADQRGTELTIKWGPTPARWICTTDYLPPKGKVTLRFTEPGTLVTGTLTLTFTPEPEYCYYDDGGGLIDGGIDLPNFDFEVPIEPQIRRAYLMQPELIVTRVADNIPIIVTGVSITNSRGNFTGSVSMDFSSQGDANLAVNQLLLVQINGYDFYARIEQISRQQAFNQLSISGTGRTKTSELAAPWRLPISYSNTVNRSLAGMMGDILTGSGWTVELVGFNDFNVPAGVFSITGKAPVEAIAEMADMIGCMVVEDETNNKLKILPLWPVVPWVMGSTVAAINIHDAVIFAWSAQDEINQLCNACWVRGENQGVSRRVRRAGSAGNIPTEDVSASLIVTDIPARLAGTAKIVSTGKKQRIGVSLPVMADLPPLVKGMLIGVSYFGDVFKATCDATTISATVGVNGDIDVMQSVTLIRHLEVPT